jgi:hypothetical protein
MDFRRTGASRRFHGPVLVYKRLKTGMAMIDLGWFHLLRTHRREGRGQQKRTLACGFNKRCRLRVHIVGGGFELRSLLSRVELRLLEHGYCY